MTQKISPNAFRLAVSTSWLSHYHILPFNYHSILHSDHFIRSLIQGIFLKFRIFTSPIIIKRALNNTIHINLFFWSTSLFSVSILSQLILKFLNTIYPHSQFFLHFSHIPSPVFNAKILCDYLALQISLNPYLHKSLLLDAARRA